MSQLRASANDVRRPRSARTFRLMAFASMTASLIATAVAVAGPVQAAEGAISSVAVSSAEARLSSAGFHTCFVVASGDVRCWGDGTYGQLGNGILQARRSPAAVLGLHDATGVAAGHVFSCARRSTGAVACWGDDAQGELGDGGPNVGLIPQTVPGVSGAVSVAVGQSHGCALLATGTVSCWGWNVVGQLGRAAFASALPAAVVAGLTGITAITAGGDHTCALLADGTARCWGDNDHQQLGHAGLGAYSATPVSVEGLTGAIAISAGVDHTCAVLANGGARCWGSNSAGQLGNAATPGGPDAATLQTVVNVSGAVEISAADEHTCAVAATGVVRCWGRDISGQLGAPAGAATSVPVTVPGVTATAVSTGLTFSCALKASGGVNCWGGNDSGALGRATQTTFPNPPGDVVGSLAPGVLTVGGFHTCALTAAGTVQCWGDNSLGQLGINSSTPTMSSTPRTVSGLTGVVALSSGTRHTCAVLATGGVRCWGDGSAGQLGDNSSGTGHKAQLPVPVTGLTDAIAVTAGGNHTCAIRRDLTAVCWGGNDDGQLGDNSQSLSATPQAVQGISHIGQISAGSGHTCAVTADAKAWCWGANGAVQLGEPAVGARSLTPVAVRQGMPGTQLSTVVEIGARYGHSCAVLANGTVMCWGDNTWGELGHGTVGVADGTPRGVDGVTGAISIGPTSNHGVHECAVLATGTAMCWGANDQGQLGRSTVSPTEVAAAAVSNLTGVVQVGVGFQDSCALLADGTARCWGNNDDLQLGSTAATPVKTPQAVGSFSVGPRAAVVDAGASHTCAVVSDGTARCWGAGASGRLGDGTTTTRTKPVTVSGLSGATAISAGGSHTCAIVAGGTARCWGLNSSGQLGNNSTTSHSTPVTVSSLSGVIAISAGGSHTCALLSNGTVKCWGLNSSGQLGDGTTTSRHTPVTVKTSSTGTLSGVIAISAGTSHTCALLSNGTARCWGAGANGRLGNGSTANKPYASTSVSGVTSTTAAASRFASISAGGAHTCARLANGTAKCWGAGGSGRLGNGSTADHSTPVTVSGLTSVAQVSAGGAHGCALLSNGTAKCWGADTYGQLGINSTSSHSTPVTVSGLAGSTCISAGGNHTAATLATGSLRAWGLNTSGQVGDGTTTNRLTPRGVSGF